jgi:hypothetical protein
MPQTLPVEEHRQHIDHGLAEHLPRSPPARRLRPRSAGDLRSPQQYEARGIKLAGVQPCRVASGTALNREPGVPLTAHEPSTLGTVARPGVRRLRHGAPRLNGNVLRRELCLGRRRPGDPQAMTVAARSDGTPIDFASNQSMAIYRAAQIHRSFVRVGETSDDTFPTAWGRYDTACSRSRFLHALPDRRVLNNRWS